MPIFQIIVVYCNEKIPFHYLNKLNKTRKTAAIIPFTGGSVCMAAQCYSDSIQTISAEKCTGALERIFSKFQ